MCSSISRFGRSVESIYLGFEAVSTLFQRSRENVERINFSFVFLVINQIFKRFDKYLLTYDSRVYVGLWATSQGEVAG
jgi:hypothetical protein